VLYGGAGLDAYYGGAGNDSIDAADGTSEIVDCGSGLDRATVDDADRIAGCERVVRVEVDRATAAVTFHYRGRSPHHPRQASDPAA
jgi:Ca2+-binding RTX toxin-like protein